ncbi:MAG: glycosyltransferase [Fischerella sp.]|nr:glycosyltransferase [Fischerella sp.]
MKIAFLVGQFPVLSETFILNQIVGMIERGHEVDIYALDGKADRAYKTHPEVEKYRLLERTYRVPTIPANKYLRQLKGLGLLIVNFYKSPLFLLRSLNFFKYRKRATSLQLLYSSLPFIGKDAYDIIHCQFGPLGILALDLRDIGILKGKKLLTSFRGYDISRQIQESGNDIYNQLFIEADFFLTNCDYFRQRILKLGCDENKVIVHRSGLDCSKFIFTSHHPHPDGKIRIAMTGRLVEKKGVEYTIRAIAKVAKTHQNIEYNIIGDGDLREQLQQLIQDLNVGHIVNLLGWRNQEEIITILNNSHIFIAPSITAKDGNQDAPINVLKEAMAMGLPVVSTFHGGIPELVEDGISGFLVPERDADALAEKLVYLMENPQIWPDMGRAGRACVEQHYNLHQLNDKLVEIYQQLLGQGVSKIHSLDKCEVA